MKKTGRVAERIYNDVNGNLNFQRASILEPFANIFGMSVNKMKTNIATSVTERLHRNRKYIISEPLSSTVRFCLILLKFYRCRNYVSGSGASTVIITWANVVNIVRLIYIQFTI